MDVWQRILADPDLQRARAKLSLHELRTIIGHARDAEDAVPYDPQGPEVTALHHWFAENAAPANWHDDGCRSENARGLLNALAKAGFIVVPIRHPTTGGEE